MPARGAPANPAATAAALSRGRWLVLATSPLGGRQAPEVAWTGAKLLEIGGMAALMPLVSTGIWPAAGSARVSWVSPVSVLAPRCHRSLAAAGPLA
jgi:hypothetical protein